MPKVPEAKFSLTVSSGAVFTAALAIQVIGFIGSFFLYRRIGIDDSGRVIIGTAQFFLLIASSINGVGDLRLGTAYTYFLARGKPARENTTVYLVLRTAMVAAAGVVVFVIAPISFGGSAIVQGSSTISLSNELTFLGLFLTLPIAWSLSTVYNQLFVGEGNSLRAQIPPLVEATARLPVLVFVAFYATTAPMQLEGMTLAYVVGALASMMITVPAVLARSESFRLEEARRLFRFAWPLMGSLVLTYFVTNMVPLIVNAALGKAQLSVFLAANGFRVLLLSLPAAVTTPLFPYLAGLHRQEKYERLRRGTWQALRYSAMLMIPGAVALVTYRYSFLNIFANKTYASLGALPLAILAIGALPLALSQIIQSSINAIGRQRLELYITATQVAVLFVAVVLFVPPWGLVPIYPGLVAGSLAILASSVAALALNTYFMETLIRVHIHPLSIARIFASAAGTFASFSLLNHLNIVTVRGSPELFLTVVMGFVVYFVLLAAVGELSKEDVHRIGDSLGFPPRGIAFLSRFCWTKSSPDLPPVDLARAPGLRTVEFPETFTGTTERPELGPLPPNDGNGPPPDPP